MRFWHPSLLQNLPDKKLLTLHMSICRVRRNPWGKPTPKTWYYNLSWGCLVWYHGEILKEMTGRGFKPSIRWLDPRFRGKLEPSEKENDFGKNYLDEFEKINFDSLERQKRVLNK